MKNLRIATWNIKNSYFNIQKNEIKAASIIQLLRTENLDILALQEVNPLLAKKIERDLEWLDGNYAINTTYKKSYNPIMNLRIEYNMIVSKMNPILNSATEDLPSTPKGINRFKFWERRKRNMTTQILERDLIVDVTHLDYTSEELGKRQMDEVANIVKEQREASYDVILAGTLNRQPDEYNMIGFSQQLAEVEMKVVDNPHKTYINHREQKPVDYIIVPTNWEVECVQTLEEYSDISSHLPVIAQVKKK